MKQVKVYYVNINKANPRFSPNKCNPSEFIKEAEKQGSVFTMEEFQRSFNGLGWDINTDDGYIRFIEVGEDVKPEREFPNGFESWAETHHIVTETIVEMEIKEIPSKLIDDRREEEGMGGIWQLSIELTDEFEKKYKGVEWEGTGEIGTDYFETIEAFLDEKLK